MHASNISELPGWTALKLEYLDQYLQAYRIATKSVDEAYYIDLFAGSGHYRSKYTGDLVDGSPWRALHATPPFSMYFFLEKNRAKADYLEQEIYKGGITNAIVKRGDCNATSLDEILEEIPRRALSFAFVDPNGLQAHWSTINKLAQHRIGHRKMELLILYPYDMAINRCIAVPSNSGALTTYYGDESWKTADLESRRLGESESQRRERFVNLYTGKLSSLGYEHVYPSSPLGYGKHHHLYNVIYASDEPIGQRIMESILSKAWAIPGHLDYQPVRRLPINPNQEPRVQQRLF